MTNRKTTRRALVLSLLSLLLCCSMLVGTTFAWFTDSVTSGNNQIVAGNLDIELEYSKDMTEGSWKPVNGATELFSDTLWEPGHTQVVYLRLKNVGTLALKYEFAMNYTDTVIGTSVEGNEIKLSEHLKYDIVEVAAAYANRDAARAAVDQNAKTLAAYSVSGTMAPESESKPLALVVYMPEEVGNEANYRGTAAPQIDLGLNLYATQLVNEEDSFGPDYDADATYPQFTYYVNNDAEFQAVLAELNKATDVESALIVLNANITWETGAGGGSTPWIEEGAAVKSVIVDGKNHTITATGAGVGPIRMANGGKLTIKNAKIDDKSESYAENSWEYGYLEFAGNLAFENCQFVKAVMMESDTADFIGCSFNSNAASEYDVWVSDGKASFKNCAFAGYRGLKTHEAYGSEVSTILVDGCTFTNLAKKPGVAIGNVNADTTITIQNSTFTNCKAGDQGLYIYETDTDVNTFNFTEQNNTVVNNATVVTTADELIAALEAGENVVMANDIKIDNASLSNAYGATGVNLKAGQTLDGAGHTLTVKRAGGTWDSAIRTAGGTIKNITVTGAFRGIFILENAEKVVLENVTTVGTTYTISCDKGGNGGILATGCTFYGWTSFAKTVGNAKFVDCTFAKGSGYAFCRPYAPTEFVGCEFQAGYKMDADGAVTFENCTLGGAAVTAENMATLVTGHTANATVK